MVDTPAKTASALATLANSAVSALSNPLTALVQALQAAFGKAYEPTGTVRQARADAAAKLIAATADLDVEDLRLARAALRVNAETERQQTNLDATLEHTVLLLQSEPPERKATQPDPAWVDEWADHAKRAHEEEVRELWARILAGEILNPNSFSKRTLAALQLMSREEAETFRHFCAYLLNLGDPSSEKWVFLHPTESRAYFDSQGIVYTTLQGLESVGLITSGDTSLSGGAGKGYDFSYHGESFQIARPAEGPALNFASLIPLRLLSQTGDELRSILEVEFVPGYVDKILDSLTGQHGWIVRKL